MTPRVRVTGVEPARTWSQTMGATITLHPESGVKGDRTPPSRLQGASCPPGTNPKAARTGLEPATISSTSCCSNQLSYKAVYQR